MEHRRKSKVRPPLKSLLRIRWGKNIPKLVVHEKYEKVIKWTLRILTLIGIVSSIITFHVWYLSLLFAIGLFTIEIFFEKSIFQYTSLFVQPLPNFKYNESEWKAMAYLIDKNLPNIVGCAFSSKEYAIKFFNLLKEWNYNSNEDKENNICLSFIIEKTNEYSVYLYANPERKSVVKTFEKIKEIHRHKNKELQRLIFQFVICKSFPYNNQSHINMFLKYQPQNKPFLFRPFIVKENGSFEMLEDNTIVKYQYKLKKRDELTNEDYEYLHGKKAMKVK